MTWHIQTSLRASAIICGLALGVREGCPTKVWLLPANICPAVPLALAAVNAEFEFVDINVKTLSLDVNACLRRLNSSDAPSVCGIIYVRTYGTNSFGDIDIASIRQAGGGNLFIIDDRCLCIPETTVSTIRKGQVENEMADAIVFSTGYGKVVDLGGGGYAFLRSNSAFKAPQSRNIGGFEKMLSNMKDIIAQRSPVQANQPLLYLSDFTPEHKALSWKILKAQIEQKVPNVLQHKDRLNHIYRSQLAPHLDIGETFHNWRFNIFVKDPKKILRAIFGAGLYASNHYYPANKLFADNICENSEHLHNKILNLFNDFHYTQEQAIRTAEIIRQNSDDIIVTRG